MERLSREKKLYINSSVGLVSQAIMICCGLILPTVILSAYGSKAYGLTSSINQFLGFIQLCELGVGAVVQSALYKPLATGDIYTVSCILKSSRKFFRIVGTILLVYVGLLCLFYPSFTQEYDYFYVVLMIISLSINAFANYFLGMNNSLLLQADQKSFIPLGLQAIATLVNTVVSLVLIKSGASLLVVKYSTAFIFLLRPILMIIYVKKNYHVDYSVVYESEPIKQKWNGLAQHFASVIVDHTDVVVLTVFSTLENVSIYSVYYLVVSNIRNMIFSALSGVQATMGNMLANKEYKALNNFFDNTEWMIHTIITLLYSITGVLIIPFVLLYTRNVHDADYVAPLFSVLIVIANAGFCVQNIYKTIVKAAGHYKQTQLASIIEAVINVVSSVFLVFKFGIIGVAIGTILAMAYRLLYHVWYMKHNIIYRSYKPFVKQIVVDTLIVLIISFTFNVIKISASSYIEWVIIAIAVSVFSIIISLIVNLIFYKDLLCLEMSKVFKKIKR